MIVKHSNYNVIRPISSKELTSFIGDSRRVIDEMLSFVTALDDFNDKVIDDDELLEALESVTLDCYYVRLFAGSMNSNVQAINHYLTKTISIIDTFIYDQTVVIQSGCYLEADEMDNLRSFCSAIISGFVYSLWHEFDLETLLDTYAEKSKDYDIDEAFRDYTGSNNIDPIEEANLIKSLMSVYKLRLEFFDAYPELEYEFESIMGPHLAAVEEDNLTIELVNSLLNGDITPEELCALTRPEGQQRYGYDVPL